MNVREMLLAMAAHARVCVAVDGTAMSRNSGVAPRGMEYERVDMGLWPGAVHARHARLQAGGGLRVMA